MSIIREKIKEIGILINFMLILILVVYGFNLFSCHRDFMILKKDSFLYEFGKYDNIIIPDGVKLYFSDILFSCDVTTFTVDRRPARGFYKPYSKEIFIDKNLDSFNTKSTLIHEIAHHRYHHVVNEMKIEGIEKEYELRCENPSEYYAYKIQDLYEDIGIR